MSLLHATIYRKKEIFSTILQKWITFKPDPRVFDDDLVSEDNDEEDKIIDSESNGDNEEEYIETDKKEEEVRESESDNEDEMVSNAVIQWKKCKSKWVQPPQLRLILEKKLKFKPEHGSNKSINQLVYQ